MTHPAQYANIPNNPSELAQKVYELNLEIVRLTSENKRMREALIKIKDWMPDNAKQKVGGNYCMNIIEQVLNQGGE